MKHQQETCVPCVHDLVLETGSRAVGGCGRQIKVLIYRAQSMHSGFVKSLERVGTEALVGSDI